MKRPFKARKHKINGEVRFPQVRVTGDGGGKIMSSYEASKIAEEMGVDAPIERQQHASALQHYLQPGDEVIFSALNVKAMVRIVREAGLVPVPVDLDLAHMGPGLDKLKAAMTARSRVFIAAHLFGCRLDQ